MDALQSQAMAQETERRRKSDLVRIDAALERLNEGECREAPSPRRGAIKQVTSGPEIRIVIILAGD